MIKKLPKIAKTIELIQ